SLPPFPAESTAPLPRRARSSLPAESAVFHRSLARHPAPPHRERSFSPFWFSDSGRVSSLPDDPCPRALGVTHRREGGDAGAAEILTAGDGYADRSAGGSCSCPARSPLETSVRRITAWL